MGAAVNYKSNRQKAAKARQQRGIALFEVLISLLTIMIFVSVLLDRLLYYQEAAEKAAMEATARELDSMLRIRAAELMLAQRYGELAQLDRVNPFTLFKVAPGGYAGEADGEVPSGSWRYDRRSGEIEYRPSSRRHLTMAQAGQEGPIRYRVRLLPGTAAGGVAGLRLELLTPYRWFE